MWLCYKYGCPGFLHWGYHHHNEGAEELCTLVGRSRYPAGNAFVIYKGDGRPWYSVRGHLQRLGSYDYELFHKLGQKNQKKAIELIERCCRTFDDYESDAELLDNARIEMLKILDTER